MFGIAAARGGGRVQVRVVLLGEDLLELLGAAILVGQLVDDPADGLAVVEVGDALLLGLVEEEALRGPGDRVDPEVVGAPAAAVVGVPVLRHVVRDRGGRGPEVAVDRGLGVRVHVVEQREAPGERVGVRGDPVAEQRELGIAVAARVVAQHLVVGAVLAHDVEDVLDLVARPRAARSGCRAGRARRWPAGPAGRRAVSASAAWRWSGSRGCPSARRPGSAGTGTS